MVISEPKPVGRRILIQSFIPRPSSPLALNIDYDKAQAQCGQVIEVGPDIDLKVWGDNGYRRLQVGDGVIFNRGAGLDIGFLFDIDPRTPKVLALDETSVISTFKISEVEIATPALVVSK